MFHPTSGIPGERSGVTPYVHNDTRMPRSYISNHLITSTLPRGIQHHNRRIRQLRQATLHLPSHKTHPSIT